MAGLNEEDFDDTVKIRNKKITISDAIEEQDDGKKKGSVAKKGKKKRKQGTKGTDADMLNVNQEEREDEWESGRGKA
jgi:hypothetical protein